MFKENKGRNKVRNKGRKGGEKDGREGGRGREGGKKGSGREGGKEMFYLTTHSTHFIYGYMGVRHMVKDHSDSETKNPLLPHGLLFPLTARVLLYAPSQTG